MMMMMMIDDDDDDDACCSMARLRATHTHTALLLAGARSMLVFMSVL